MAHGCNIDPFTMAQPTEEAQRGALAELVGAIPNLDTSPYWGEGKTSANDGQRFSLLPQGPPTDLPPEVQ